MFKTINGGKVVQFCAGAVMSYKTRTRCLILEIPVEGRLQQVFWPDGDDKRSTPIDARFLGDMAILIALTHGLHVERMAEDYSYGPAYRFTARR